MSLFKTINELYTDQLISTTEILNTIPKNIDSFTESYKKTILKRRIKSTLIDFFESVKEFDFNESYEILALWRDYALEILKKEVKPENKDQKENVIKELKALDSRDSLNDSNQVMSVVRDILLLLWMESNQKQKAKFVDLVKEDLKKQNLEFTEEQLNQSIAYLLFGGAGGVVPFAVPLVAGVMLQKLTQGFIAWFLINVLGQKALQVAVLSTLAGPIGWGIAISTGGLSVALSILKFSSERKKLRFIQAILSIYAFYYQNQFNRRRRNG